MFKVHGRVQGVFFRVSTRDVAVPLNIRGHAVNLPDNSVEVVACGNDAAVEDLLGWLRHGPPMASVTSIDKIDIECSRPTNFTTA